MALSTCHQIAGINRGEMGETLAIVPDRLVLEFPQAVRQDMPGTERGSRTLLRGQLQC